MDLVKSLGISAMNYEWRSKYEKKIDKDFFPDITFTTFNIHALQVEVAVRKEQGQYSQTILRT